jgi:hypothetical protein
MALGMPAPASAWLEEELVVLKGRNLAMASKMLLLLAHPRILLTRLELISRRRVICCRSQFRAAIEILPLLQIRATKIRQRMQEDQAYLLTAAPKLKRKSSTPEMRGAGGAAAQTLRHPLTIELTM